MVEEDINDTNNTISKRKYLIGPVIFINVYAFSLSFLVLPQYGFIAFQKKRFPNNTFVTGEQSVCETNKTSQQYLDQQIVTTETATWDLYNRLASCLPAIFSNFLFGSYSDVYGRKLFLVITMFGGALKYGLCAIGAYLQWDIYIFIAFSAIDGLTGMWICFITISYSYAADITKKGKSRTFAIILVEFCVGLGAVSASITSGYLVQNFGFVISLSTCAALLILATLIVIFLLPETIKKQNLAKKSKISEQCARVFGFYVRDNPTTGEYRWKFIVCLCVFILVSHSVFGRGVETLYQLNSPFCWSSVFIGWYSTISTVSQNIVGLALAKFLQNYLSELSIAILSLTSYTCGFVLEGFATNDVQLFLVPVVGIGALLTNPMLRGYMSKMTPQDQQGSMFSGLAVFESVCGLTASLAANGIFAATLSIYRGIVFFVFAGYNIISIFLLICLKTCSSRETKTEEETEITESSSLKHANYYQTLNQDQHYN